MSFGSRLKDKRKELGITQPQLAKMLSVSQSAIGSWETDVNSPRATILYDLFEILHCDANYLFQDETRELYSDRATPEEFENIIKKYRSLDQHGQETVSYILERELDHKNQIERARNSKQTVIDYPTRFMTYYHNLASAGTGEYIFDDLPIDTIEIPANELSERADFVIGVNGDSMEPTYYDGDKVYVEKCPSVEIGDIGIFMINGECFIKEAGKDGLISHNKKYNIIPGGDNVQCIGKVLGKVEER